jgi:hypothetical protein
MAKRISALTDFERSEMPDLTSLALKKSKPNETWLSKKSQPITVGILVNGGGGGNRTRVRKPYTGSSTYLVRYFCALSLITPAEQAEFRRAALI